MVSLRAQTTPASWLSFEVSVLKRLEFRSVCMPFTTSPSLGTYLKRIGIRTSANDPMQSLWTEALASIQNNGERLTDDDVNTLLEDVYVPGYKLKNPSLRNWFSETDSWWFDNVRNNLDRLQSPFASAIASSIGMGVGDYALSFTERTLELRQPLSTVFRRLWTIFPEPVNNGQNNTCLNKSAEEFVAESIADLMFLRLPPAGGSRELSPNLAWREEWIRGGSEFWGDAEIARRGKFGSPVETKSQYLQLLEELLKTASHIPGWAISLTEGGFVTASEISEVISGIRKNVDALFTKDFSELTGAKAVIITA